MWIQNGKNRLDEERFGSQVEGSWLEVQEQSELVRYQHRDFECEANIETDLNSEISITAPKSARKLDFAIDKMPKPDAIITQACQSNALLPAYQNSVI